jgi:hypothetical protein
VEDLLTDWDIGEIRALEEELKMAVEKKGKK